MSGNFELDISRFVDKAKGNITLVIRKVSLDIFKRVILKTPVDTGRARGSWQCAIGSIPSDTIELNDKSGTATIARVTAETLQLKAGDVIYLVSNLAYISALEHGWSKQAPAGMVKLTLLEFNAIVTQAAGEVNR